ncbi:GNAT family N-acetyltransferase [Bacillaceae bacterium Marseille-Q3522]|nr:GNAT family N-acetyltransferase [Bacillaceae bacterium Marseille-Q3522]
MKNIKITEYHHDLAKEVAKMWNLSNDSWGGDGRIKTEEQVKQQEDNSGNIALYLALDGNEVVGYCGFSEYKEDTGSLYIPLLNVRPDYHGKKIGKLLVQKAVAKTVELGWPRLDLYTWPGNLKAVPLYKKCGFFWEDRDDTTHLMNFIPTVLQTPLLKPIFAKLDWYQNSVREIEVKPDGIKENGFTFYEYKWANRDSKVRVQFERSGRGMRLIETNDFELKLELEDHQLIEEQHEQVSITFKNKTDNPMSVKIDGVKNERVSCMFQAEQLVTEEAVLTGAVLVKPGEAANTWRTHPVVAVQVTINGKPCELRLGISPKQPARVEGKLSGTYTYVGEEAAILLETENNLKEPATMTIVFHDNEYGTLPPKLTTLMDTKERKLLTIPLTVKKHGYFKQKATIQLKTKNGNQYSFSQNIGVPLKGFAEKFAGESDEYWYLYNGLCQVNIRKRDYGMTAGRNEKEEQPLFFFMPEIGKPFSSEMAKKKPLSIDFDTNSQTASVFFTFASEVWEGLTLRLCISLYGDGLLKRWLEVENQHAETYRDIFINQRLFCEKEEMYFPLNGEVVYFNEKRELNFHDIPMNALSSNWFFSNNPSSPFGITWPKSVKASPEGWRFYMEYHKTEIKAGETAVFEPIFLSIGAFQQWEELQAFAEKRPAASKQEVLQEKRLEHLHVLKQEESQFSLTLQENRAANLQGEWNLYVNEQLAKNTQIDAADEKNYFITTHDRKALTPVSLINGVLKGKSVTTELDSLLLVPNGKIETANNGNSFSVCNGQITILADPAFYPGIYSLSVNGKEWLDTSYPELIAKAWWNPWGGGLKYSPTQLTTFSLKKETVAAQFVERIDLEGNTWSGLAIDITVRENGFWKGLQYVQYYLMLPGIPVLASFVEVLDGGGKNHSRQKWILDGFFKNDKQQPLTLFSNKVQSRAGSEENVLYYQLGDYLATSDQTEKLYAVEGLQVQHTEIYMNKEVCYFESLQQIKNHSSYLTEPNVFLFDNRILTKNQLARLRNLHFQR